MADFLRDVLAERQKADVTWPPINSHHEGYAVLLEEGEKYWEIVKQKEHLRDPKAMYHELVQVAAVAWRIVCDLGLEGVKDGSWLQPLSVDDTLQERLLKLDGWLLDLSSQISPEAAQGEARGHATMARVLLQRVSVLLGYATAEGQTS